MSNSPTGDEVALSRLDGAGSITVPSAEVLAVVRHAPPPDHAPPDLVPYVIAVGDGDEADWNLTDDALAFGEVDVPRRFSEWREGWTRTWTLDPFESIVRLGGLARELLPTAGTEVSSIEHLLLRHLTVGGSVSLPASQHGVLSSELEQLADVVRDRDATSYGVIDTTEGTERTGLARAWPAHGEPGVVASDAHLEVVYRPESGLMLRVLDLDPPREISPIEEVVFDDEQVHVSSGGDHHVALATDRARPLAWLVPGSGQWRVRPIPEIIAWASTFGGVEESCRYASSLGLPILFTTHRPIFDKSTTPFGT